MHGHRVIAFGVAALVLGTSPFVLPARAREARQPSSQKTEPKSPSQADVEAQLARMLDELRRENARRGVTPLSQPEPPTTAPDPAAAKSTITTSAPPPQAVVADPLPIPVPPAVLSAPAPATVPTLNAPAIDGFAPVVPADAVLRVPVVTPAPAPRPAPPPATTPAPSAASPPVAAPAPASVTSPITPAPAVVPALPPSAPAAPTGVRPPLPSVEGFAVADAQAFLGMPNAVLRGPGGSFVWHYATPSGRQHVYIVSGVATMTPPASGRGAGPAPRTALSPGACEGVRAATGLKSIAVLNQGSPVFIEAKFRAQPLTLLPVGKTAEVLSADGAWYLIRFNDERWGPRQGFIHCSDVTRLHK